MGPGISDVSEAHWKNENKVRPTTREGDVAGSPNRPFAAAPGQEFGVACLRTYFLGFHHAASFRPNRVLVLNFVAVMEKCSARSTNQRRRASALTCRFSTLSPL